MTCLSKPSYRANVSILAVPQPRTRTTGTTSTGRRLYVADMRRVWNEERAKQGLGPIKKNTFWSTLAACWPAPPGQPANRYQNNPMPLPSYPHPDRPRKGQKPFWPASAEQGLRDWLKSREGQGGPQRGRRIPFAPRRRTCGCGQTVAPGSSCGSCAYPLTRRERFIAFQLVEGLPFAAIAAKLGTSPNTVRNQCRGLYRKLDVHSRAEMIQVLVAEPGDLPDLGPGVIEVSAAPATGPVR